MKIYLIGQCKLKPALKYLLSKYVPKQFKIIFLEYQGPIENWSSYLAGELEKETDKNIILGLDDFLICDHVDMQEYERISKEMDKAVLAKLCFSTEDENSSYPVSAQYTLWDREYLISLLRQTTDPWNFEIKGNKLFKKSGKTAVFAKVFNYYTNSALSSRWEGIRLNQLNEEDVKEVQKLI